MAIINNTATIKRILDDAKIQTSIDDVPKQLASKVVPVLISNPYYYTNVCKFISSTTTGAKTALTTEVKGRTFYLTSIHASYGKNATCDVSTGSLAITGYVDTVVRNLMAFQVTTLLAEKSEQNFSFPIPVKIDKDTAISFSGTFAAGNMSRTLTVYGYYVED